MNNIFKLIISIFICEGYEETNKIIFNVSCFSHIFGVDA